MESITERIKKVISDKELNAAKFADMLQVQRSGISHVLSGRNKPGLELIQKIISVFPDLDALWLLTGKAEKQTKKPQSEVQKEEKTSPFQEVTFVNNVQKENKPLPFNEVDSKEKHIEKIIIFYNDQTFSVRLPE